MRAVQGTLVTAGLLLLLALLLPGTAAFAEERVYDSAEECLSSGSTEPDMRAGFQMPTYSCRGVGDTWYRIDEAPGGPPGLGTFVVIAVIWSMIPLTIAAVMASNRGESAVAAIGLTLVLGWVGLAIVYAGQNRSRQAAAELLDGRHARRRRGPTRSGQDVWDPDQGPFDGLD